MKNTLLEGIISLGIQAKLDRITERLGYAALNVQPISAEREARLRALHAELVEIQFMHGSSDSEVTLEQRIKNVNVNL
jgi:hypothetical protein